MKVSSIQMLAFSCIIMLTMCSPRGLRGAEEQSTSKFVTPQGDTPYIGVCPYPSGCGPDCGTRWAGWSDCPQVCPGSYKLVCQDNATSGDGRPPSAVCTGLGDGFKLVGIGGSRGITCCTCELDVASDGVNGSAEALGHCDFDSDPVDVGSFWDPTCKMGDLGCNADGKHVECRLCGAGNFINISCPASSCRFQNEPYVPYYWDTECEIGQLGCWADGVHKQCRFCGDYPFTGVTCPEGAMHRRAAQCAFDVEPTTRYFWDSTCYMGKHGCNADGEHAHCRFCGSGGFEDVHCPGSQVCEFDNLPAVPFYWDPQCTDGMLGCKADGVHPECRFCAERPFEAVPCPEPIHAPQNECSWPQRGEPSVPHFWDETCEMGKLGCWADGIHAECRFCGSGIYEAIACPNVTR